MNNSEIKDPSFSFVPSYVIKENLESLLPIAEIKE